MPAIREKHRGSQSTHIPSVSSSGILMSRCFKTTYPSPSVGCGIAATRSRRFPARHWQAPAYSGPCRHGASKTGTQKQAVPSVTPPVESSYPITPCNSATIPRITGAVNLNPTNGAPHSESLIPTQLPSESEVPAATESSAEGDEVMQMHGDPGVSNSGESKIVCIQPDQNDPMPDISDNDLEADGMGQQDDRDGYRDSPELDPSAQSLAHRFSLIDLRGALFSPPTTPPITKIASVSALPLTPVTQTNIPVGREVIRTNNFVSDSPVGALFANRSAPLVKAQSSPAFTDFELLHLVNECPPSEDVSTYRLALGHMNTCLGSFRTECEVIGQGDVVNKTLFTE